jgi:hypothetical protein
MTARMTKLVLSGLLALGLLAPGTAFAHETPCNCSCQQDLPPVAAGPSERLEPEQRETNSKPATEAERYIDLEELCPDCYEPDEDG